MSIDTDERVDLSDLDLLDDDTEHAVCTECYPVDVTLLGKKITALCGAETLFIRHHGPRCRRCAELVDGACPVCGASS